MGFPAARIGDTTMHGGTVTLGTPLTLVGSMPASRIGDLHVCPALSPAPHVGGPIILGAFNVLVGGPPQARMLDSCICTGAPSMVLLGSFTTLVGMEGMFSGGIAGAIGLIAGGLAAGIRNVGGGYPRAVACPKDAANPAGYYTEYAPGIRIHGTPEFQAAAIQRLNTVASTPSGRAVLAQIEGSGRTMDVVEFTGNNSFCGANATWDDLRGSTPAGQQVYDGNGNPITGPDGNPLIGNGRGANTTLQLNPNLTIPNANDPSNPLPNDAVLFHELTHGGRQMTGNQQTSPAPGGWDTNEERLAIRDGTPSESDYLRDRSYPWQRTDHDSHWAPNP